MGKKKSIPLRTRSYIAIRDNGICQICGKIGVLKPTYFGYMAYEKAPAWSSERSHSSIYKGFLSFDIDHIRPESKEGGMDLENLRLTCRRCNRSKGAKYGKSMV